MPAVTSSNIHLPIKVIPGAQRSQVVGKLGNRLKVKVQAPPEAGKANRAVMELVARELGIPEQQIELVFGTSSPEKLLRISPQTEQEFARVQQVLKGWMSE